MDMTPMQDESIFSEHVTVRLEARDVQFLKLIVPRHSPRGGVSKVIRALIRAERERRMAHERK